jgi:hypothetical protein
MNAIQKAEGMMALHFAQNALTEVLQRLGADRPRSVADAVHESVRLLDEARWALRNTEVK